VHAIASSAQEVHTWPTVWTLGHSTRPIDEFLAVLESHEIELLADVRRFAASRRLPQFEASALEASLATRDIAYQWIPSLGGRRRAAPDSPNDGWRNTAFRAYADHVSTEEFAEGLFELLMAANGLRTAIMCSEILWWRCHRRIIADVLESLGVPVVHIRDSRVAEPHRLASPARIVAGSSPTRSSDTRSKPVHLNLGSQMSFTRTDPIGAAVRGASDEQIIGLERRLRAAQLEANVSELDALISDSAPVCRSGWRTRNQGAGSRRACQWHGAIRVA
jgi:uncharacterized protein (DUF488 family)